MKTKIVIILVLATLVIASLSASGFTIQKNETLNLLNDPTPKIYHMAAYSSGKQVESGYTSRDGNILYKARSKNEIGGEVDMVFDWGDGTTSTHHNVKGWIEPNHEYERSGVFSVKVRYAGYSSWSEPFEFPVFDHCDLKLKEVFTEPAEFGKRDTINIKATAVNIGTISTTQDTTLKLFEGYNDYAHNNPIKQISTGLIGPGEEITITLEDFKWYGDKLTHSFWAKVEPVPGEIDWTTIGNTQDPNVNNVGDGAFTAPKLKMQNYMLRILGSLSIFQKLL